jgi:tetratricopeptide (TPR) repeat protein
MTDGAFIVEQGQRLSQSRLWALNRRFYMQQGMRAWLDGPVPFNITANAHLAYAYAQVIHAYARQQALDPTQPMYIVELGAGTGRFAYYIVRRLAELLPDLPFCYVLTDIAPDNVQFWQKHQSLRRFVSAGQVDFAQFDLERDHELMLLHSGRAIGIGQLRNPLVIVSNYVFDSVPHDLFRVEDGQLYEHTVTLTSDQHEADLDDPAMLNRLHITYQPRPIAADYYPEADYNALLRYYQDNWQTRAEILYPIGILRALARWRALSGDRLLVLAADKGFHDEQTLRIRSEPGLNIHGSFSITTDFFALQQYAEAQGGRVLIVPHYFRSLNFFGMVFDKAISAPSPAAHDPLAVAFNAAFVAFSPDDLFTAIAALAKVDKMEPDAALALLRLSQWNTRLFIDLFPLFAEQIHASNDYVKFDLYYAAVNLWENYYYLGEQPDLGFYLGLMMSAVEHYALAITYFEQSLLLSGRKSGTLFNLAQCYQRLGDIAKALELTHETLQVAPQYPPAVALLRELSEDAPPQDTGA